MNNDYLIVTFILNTTHLLKGHLREIVIKYPTKCLDANVSFEQVSIIGTEKLCL